MPLPSSSSATARSFDLPRFVAGVVAVLVFAATLAATLNSADAATTRTWHRLANCESGGRWHINTGNGFYGGLQFTLGTWRSFGGGKFASRADLATRNQQMTVAERVLKAQRWGAWPVCSQKLGLTHADATATDKTLKGTFVHAWRYEPGWKKAPKVKPLPALPSP